MSGKWKGVNKRRISRFAVFDLMMETYISPRTGEPYPFYVLETPDWVNVIPITPDDKVVMIRQFRAGIGEVVLEIPGGLVDADDDTPLDAARRELREETGYNGSEFVHLGTVHPNPAILNNRCHTFLARSVWLTGEQQLDQGEAIEVVPVPLKNIPGMIADGDISHSQVLNAFQWFFGLRHPR
jgi:8-oxo-dGTP pyrophosphatase MutT (NUDIX family)